MTHVRNPRVKKGDRRFLANEIVQEVIYSLYRNLLYLIIVYKLNELIKPVFQDYRNLPKADVFALALTVLTACEAKALPRNGEMWHAIRRGKLPHVARALSEEFQQLLKVCFIEIRSIKCIMHVSFQKTKKERSCLNVTFTFII